MGTPWHLKYILILLCISVLSTTGIKQRPRGGLRTWDPETGNYMAVVLITIQGSLWTCWLLFLTVMCCISAYLTRCDFNNNSRPFCDWTQPCNINQGMWIRTKHDTPTDGTGPDGDYPDGKGYFIYQEASNLIPFDTNRLESPDTVVSGKICIDFWYYMFGSEEMNELRVLIQDSSGQSVVWHRKGNQSSFWEYGAITHTFPTQRKIKVIFEAVRGLTEYGDTALDNVRVRDGPCEPVPTPVPPTPTPTEPTPAPVTEAICSIHGDPHYNTFDKQRHDFMGTCTYTLSKLCDSNSSLPYFNVEAANEHRRGNTRVSYVQYVDVDVYGYRINLGQKKAVKVNGVSQVVPVTLVPGVSISLSGQYVVVTTDFGLQVKFDGNHRAEIILPSTYMSKVCGICGNYNGQKADDFLNPDGEMEANSTSLGNSWQVYNDSRCSPDYGHTPNCTDEEKHMIQSNAYCGLITDPSGPFQNCHAVVDPRSYFEDCQYDLCELHLNNAALCESLQAYADVCQAAGVQLEPWRNATFCPIACPPNSHYNPCTSACPATCTDPLASQNCSRPCVEGCECNSGFVLSGGQCVSMSNCGCLQNGKYYEKGESFWQPDCVGQCVCTGNGTVVCNSDTCEVSEVCKVQNGLLGCYPLNPSTCHIFGDPHYLTFDGKLYHFQGDCNYTAVERCTNSSEKFSVTTKNEHRGNPNWTALNSVAVTLKNLHIVLKKNKETYVNGDQVHLPVDLNHEARISIQRHYIVIDTSLGIQVKFDGDQELFILVDESLKGQLCGLCGTFNDNQQDDFLNPDKVLEQDPNKFGDSWIVKDDNRTCNQVSVVPPACDTEKEKEYEELCKIILKSGGPFQLCHSHIPPQLYFESCVYDLCATEGDSDQYCKILEAYAAACEAEGVNLGEWREDTICAAPPACNMWCTFEADFCEWKQETTDDFDWIRHKGPTPTPNTGPSHDHTTGEGYYIYLQGSKQKPADIARLVSPVCSSEGLHCFRFWYHMYGAAETMALRVYVVHNETSTLEWKDAGNKEDRWNLGEVTVHSRGNMQIVLEGMIGEDLRSDVALDDLSIVKGQCTDGYYIFLQGSADTLPGFVARLVSPECSWEGTLCFSFWYHMYGTAQTMALRVYVQKGEELVEVWKEVGNHGDMWYLGEVTVNTTGNFQILLDGEWGEDVRSNIALDDLSVVQGACAGIPTPTPTVPLPGNTTQPVVTTSPIRPTPSSGPLPTTPPTLLPNITTPSTPRPTTPPGMTSGRASCSASGDPHYNTFDHKVHNFMGNCTYTLSKVCTASESLPYFDVSTTNEHRGANTKVSYVKSVHVEVYDHQISLLKNKKVNVNGHRMTLPVFIEKKISIQSSGGYVLLETDFGLWVRYDGNHYAEVSVPSNYSGLLCGLCGNYNGDPNDDNIKSNGDIASDSTDLGESWLVPENNTICSSGGKEEQCDPVLESEAKKNTACGMITDPTGIFKDCHSKVPPQNFFENCVYDMCFTGGQAISLCYGLQAYAESCVNAGICIEWRNATLCPMSCPGGSIYQSCGTRCPSTCLNMSADDSCSSLPVEGCFCKEGYVLSGDKCLNESWFPRYPCTERCTCRADNTIECTSWECGVQEECSIQDGVLGCHSNGQAICQVVGDPHYFTFDGMKYTFVGTCTYTLVEVVNTATNVIPITILGKNEDRGLRGATYLKEVYIDVYGVRITLQKNQGILLNNERVYTPVQNRLQGVSIGNVGRFIVVETDFGVIVKFDGNHHLEITLPRSYFSQVHGMCGNFNGNLEDDLSLTNGTTVTAPQFGNSWEVEKDSDKGCLPDLREDEEPPCTAENKQVIEKQCNVLKSDKFKVCHSLVNPDDFIEICIYDMCQYDGMKSALCDIVQVYVDTCKNHGITIKWRNSTFCPLPCPSRSHYKDCVSPCPSTCSDIFASSLCENTEECTEGCECDDNYVLSNGNCVPLSSCGCRNDDNNYYSAGETWLTPHCTQRCQCQKNGVISCRSYSCDSRETCVIKDGKHKCNPTSFGICQVMGDPHYTTFDRLVHHFQGKYTYILAQTTPDLPDTLTQFSIEGMNYPLRGSRHITYLKEMLINVYNHTVRFRHNKQILLDGVRVRPPVRPHEGIRIYQRLTRIYLETDFGLYVSFDGIQNADIKLATTYRSRVEGLCGDFDGRYRNDFKNPDGVWVRNVNTFGESWKVPLKRSSRLRRDVNSENEPEEEPDTGLFQGCNENQLEQQNTTSNCQILTNLNGPFAKCHSAVQPDFYFTSCLFDSCVEGDEILCRSLEEYVLACQQQGVSMDGWRQQTDCGMSCPPNSKYSSCMSACPASCNDLTSPSECESPCVEGCECLPGYVLSGFECVPYKQCGCTYLNKYYEVRSLWVRQLPLNTCNFAVETLETKRNCLIKFWFLEKGKRGQDLLVSSETLKWQTAFPHCLAVSESYINKLLALCFFTNYFKKTICPIAIHQESIGESIMRIGEIFTTDDCSQKCQCTESSTVFCSDEVCGSGEICDISNYTRGCYRSGPCMPNPCKNDGICSETSNSTSLHFCECSELYTGLNCEAEKIAEDPGTEDSDYTIAIVIGVVAGVVVIVILISSAVYLFRTKRNVDTVVITRDSSLKGSRDKLDARVREQDYGCIVNSAFDQNESSNAHP
ncbi:hypothetical protein EK904_011288 [Melospiza melodia maxima]|nr:hypothetical protein EK904_011288 [Melospiza melodia maxima]